MHRLKKKKIEKYVSMCPKRSISWKRLYWSIFTLVILFWNKDGHGPEGNQHSLPNDVLMNGIK